MEDKEGGEVLKLDDDKVKEEQKLLSGNTSTTVTAQHQQALSATTQHEVLALEVESEERLRDVGAWLSEMDLGRDKRFCGLSPVVLLKDEQIVSADNKTVYIRKSEQVCWMCPLHADEYEKSGKGMAQKNVFSAPLKKANNNLIAPVQTAPALALEQTNNSTANNSTAQHANKGDAAEAAATTSGSAAVAGTATAATATTATATATAPTTASTGASSSSTMQASVSSTPARATQTATVVPYNTSSGSTPAGNSSSSNSPTSPQANNPSSPSNASAGNNKNANKGCCLIQ